MRPDSGPHVPPSLICQCRVPVWVTQHNYWVGWGATVCTRCKRHGMWGNCWARLYPNTSRRQIFKQEGVSNS